MKLINRFPFLIVITSFFCFQLQIIVGDNALAIELPDQKFTVGLPIASYTKETLDPKTGNTSGSLPVGFGAEYSIFLTKTMSLDGQFEVNLESNEQSIVFMGGSGGTKWYLIGGSNDEHVDAYLNSLGTSNLNAFLSVAFAARQFDFTVLESDLSITRDRKNPIKGSVFALQLGAGVEYPIIGDLLTGVRLQYLSSFSNPNTPDLSIVEFWITTAYLL